MCIKANCAKLVSLSSSSPTLSVVAELQVDSFRYLELCRNRTDNLTVGIYLLVVFSCDLRRSPVR